MMYLVLMRLLIKQICYSEMMHCWQEKDWKLMDMEAMQPTSYATTDNQIPKDFEIDVSFKQADEGEMQT